MQSKINKIKRTEYSFKMRFIVLLIANNNYIYYNIHVYIQYINKPIQYIKAIRGKTENAA